MVKKYVITGGPCCGKTTLINKLKVLEKSSFKYEIVPPVSIEERIAIILSSIAKI